MAEIDLNQATTKWQLPFLIPGQAQKEVTVNEAFARIDSLLSLAVAGVSANPPPEPYEGEAWLVSSEASGVWAGQVDRVAVCIGSAWQFYSPHPGMQVLNEQTGQYLYCFQGWQTSSEPASPSGGETVDIEARASIDAIIDALRNSGIFPRN
ncbi:DUF2793 domain-containing protein [Altererythrobacter epoxidivorans]|uniref:DUF2793 domain-containing protein n=1 Tax=Altererythrobacter epoxidivorans TaxID=361183 RepID=UPI000782F0BA|nr:DUF2793 domain-containing protein [Altererythrobacter epoxidivorans]